MFWVGGAPALLALYIRFRVRESEAWKQHRAPTVGAILRTASGHWKIFLYLVLLMTLMMFLSHGTQDLYPDFLKSARGFDSKVVAYLVILFNVGAVLGAILFGHLSESFGRRRSMILALLLCSGDDSRLDLRGLAHDPGGRGFRDAGRRSGRVGHHSRAS